MEIGTRTAMQDGTSAPQRIAVRSSGRNRRPDSARLRRLNILVGALSLPLFVGLWELASRSGAVNMVLFPPPTVVAAAVLEWIRSGQFLVDLTASLYRVTTGFMVGGALGILFGILTGQFPVMSSLLSPLFHILRPIPPIAFVPIVILWFGLSEAGKLFLVVWGVFFTVWLSTHIGVQKVDRGLIRAALMLGTPRRQMLQEIVLLGALPYIVVGLRTAVSISFYTLVAAELAGTFAGIVYRIEIAQQNMQTGQVMGGLAALGLISFIADRLFAVLAERTVWWR
ncbi:ABC transporter permease [Bradyrhizobium manausense]|uniref:ABC transporter permease n=2 Tax=Bradyrhizobium TaxID=374 RepID=A0A0R3DUU8_9BRAD|nr:ABC transporter permease [Bradyrhizobium manausense]KRQ13555.1 ABC transporter permease [Bradyrhizobium manausense]